MGASHGDFTKYPRTPHLFGSKGTDDDKHLGEAESNAFIANESLIVEEKLDGTKRRDSFCIRRRESVALGGEWLAVRLCSAQMYSC